MSLLARGKLQKLALRHAAHKPPKPGKDLPRVLALEHIDLGPADQLLDADQAVAHEVVAQLVVNLGQDKLLEPDVVVLGALELGKDLVDEAGLQQLVGGDAAAHEQGLVGLANAEALHQGARRAALCDQAKGRKRRQQKGRRRGVDEVGKGNERGRQADDGPVEPHDQDLGVRIEGLSDVEVEGHKALQPLAAATVGDAAVVLACGGRVADGGYIGAAFFCCFVSKDSFFLSKIS